ncbi:hypothetical protein SRHO_G00229800 [Serrasalmus rhombeus]
MVTDLECCRWGDGRPVRWSPPRSDMLLPSRNVTKTRSASRSGPSQASPSAERIFRITQSVVVATASKMLFPPTHLSLAHRLDQEEMGDITSRPATFCSLGITAQGRSFPFTLIKDQPAFLRFYIKESVSLAS